MRDLPGEIKECFISPYDKGNILVITVGNRFREDDGIGPYIGERLTPSEKSGIKVVNVEDKPENIPGEVEKEKPVVIIIIDAADFGGDPGEMRLIPTELLPEKTFSTHSFPLKFVVKYIEEEFNTMDVKIIGIQPARTGYGEDISEVVKQSAELLIEYINSL